MATAVKTPYIPTRGPLRVAYEAGDWTTVQSLLLSRTVTSQSCRIWQGPSKDGYPSVTIGSSAISAHRLMLRTTGVDAKGLHVHHICAESLCIQPLHLTAATPEANTAEMLERHWYRRRILELETALAHVDPDNELLAQLPFWSAA